MPLWLVPPDCSCFWKYRNTCTWKINSEKYKSIFIYVFMPLFNIILYSLYLPNLCVLAPLKERVTFSELSPQVHIYWCTVSGGWNSIDCYLRSLSLYYFLLVDTCNKEVKIIFWSFKLLFTCNKKIFQFYETMKQYLIAKGYCSSRVKIFWCVCLLQTQQKWTFHGKMLLVSLFKTEPDNNFK